MCCVIGNVVVDFFDDLVGFLFVGGGLIDVYGLVMVGICV